MRTVKTRLTGRAFTGCPAEALVPLTGPARLPLSISDARLAPSEHAARERAASDLVAALAQAMESRATFAAIRQIDMASVHAAAPRGSMSDTHVEDLLQFRRAPNHRVVPPVT